jgi:hypothetical protein
VAHDCFGYAAVGRRHRHARCRGRARGLLVGRPIRCPGNTAASKVTAGNPPANPSASGGPDAQTERRLWSLADRAAKANGGTVALAQAVKSTHLAAVKFTMGAGVTGDQAVWVLQVDGSKKFSCASCKGPPGAGAPAGRVLTMVFDASTFQEMDFGFTGNDVDLSRLGHVVNLHA